MDELTMYTNSMISAIQTIRNLAEQMRMGAISRTLQGRLLGYILGVLRRSARRLDEVAASFAQAASVTESTSRATQQVSSDVSQIAKNVRQMEAVVASRVSRLRDISLQIQVSSSIAEQLQSETRYIVHAVESIEGLAQQTHVLALNATIEATHAGDAGRGFLVVAKEVRALAAQTKEFAGTIDESIRRLVKATESLNKAVRELGQGTAIVSEEMAGILPMMEEIRTATVSTGGATETLAAASEQYSVTFQELNKQLRVTSNGIQAAVNMLSAARGAMSHITSTVRA